MQHIALLVLISITFGFISALPVSAKIYINEFSSASSDDWIELYNDGDEEVSLVGFVLRDNTETNKKDLEGTIDSQGFVVIEWNRLNADTDTIRLLKNEVLENEHIYGNSSLSAPGSEQSAGREADGGEKWLIFSSHSKGSPNSESELYEPPEPTPTLTPSPSKIPTPTKTPKPTKTLTPTKSPTPGKNPTPIETKTSPSLHTSPSIKVQDLDTEGATKSSTLGITDTSKDTSVIPGSEKTQGKERQMLGVSTSKGGIAVVTGGLLFLSACGILVFQKYRYLFMK